MNGFYEAINGFTDIPLALIALMLGMLSKRNKRKEWGDLFLLIFMTASLGVVAHAFALHEVLRRTLWVVVFVGLFEIDFIFTKLFSRYVNNSIRFNEKLFRYMQTVFCLTAIIAVAGYGNKGMLIFVAYSCCCIVFLSKCLIRTRNVPKKAILFASLLPLLLIMQTFNEVIPYAVAIEHITLTVILFILYSISRNKYEDTQAEVIRLKKAI